MKEDFRVKQVRCSGDPFIREMMTLLMIRLSLPRFWAKITNDVYLQNDSFFLGLNVGFTLSTFVSSKIINERFFEPFSTF